MSEDSPKVQIEDSGDLDIDFNYEILPDDYIQYDLSFKLIVIGDCGVGKSCLTSRATTNLFDDGYSTTLGFEFVTFNVKINGKIMDFAVYILTVKRQIYRLMYGAENILKLIKIVKSTLIG